MKECNQCGKCCVKYGGGSGLGSVTQKEYERLPQLAQRYCDKMFDSYDIWISPETGEDTESCPWLKKEKNNFYLCTIYENRPDVCRDYPHSIAQMKRDGCEML